jgi:hypothetical protein
MIVERKTIRTKQFSEQATADFCRQNWEQIEVPQAIRTYVGISGTGNTVYLEFEFENWQEREQFWAYFFALPQMAEWKDRWVELTEPGGSTEFFKLVE